jgi:hypothetical protein
MNVLISSLSSLVSSLLISLLISLSTATSAQAEGWEHATQSSAIIVQNSGSAAPTTQDPTPPNNDYFWSRWRARAATVEAADAEAPITINGGVRHPVIFFRQIANRRWAIGPLFSFLLFISALLKIFLPGLTGLATKRCQTNCYASLSAAFIYCTILIAIVRFGFNNAELTAMGVFTFGLLQLSFALGCCLGINLFTQNLYSLATSKKEPSGTVAKVLIYGICLVAVAGTMTVISMIPNLGPLPRIGNRIVVLLAALGLGGLVNLAVGSQKSRT